MVYCKKQAVAKPKNEVNEKKKEDAELNDGYLNDDGVSAVEAELKQLEHEVKKKRKETVGMNSGIKITMVFLHLRYNESH